jgi:hypothetical protein
MADRNWPGRLLHVPSMTSLHVHHENCYSGFQKPVYNALSYTWGRYRIKSGPCIQIKGISWQIPSIDESHFTIGEFHNVLCASAAEENGLLWVDIACIDQENTKAKMEEIGKQASIFRSAERCSIWLTKHTTQELSGLFAYKDCNVFQPSAFSKIFRTLGELEVSELRSSIQENIRLAGEEDALGVTERSLQILFRTRGSLPCGHSKKHIYAKVQGFSPSQVRSLRWDFACMMFLKACTISLSSARKSSLALDLAPTSHHACVAY